jgi:HEAT repeat protein
MPGAALKAARALLESHDPSDWALALTSLVEPSRAPARFRDMQSRQTALWLHRRHSLGGLDIKDSGPSIPRDMYDEALVELIVERLFDPQSPVAPSQALEFLAGIEPFDETTFRRAVDEGLAYGTQSPDDLRWRAYSLLACLGPTGAGIIAEGLENESSMTRYYAAFALLTLGNDAIDVLPRVEACTHDDVPQVATMAGLAVDRIRGEQDADARLPPMPERP